MNYEYWLISKNRIVLDVTIQPEAKEDFMKLMGWDEETWKKHTCLKYKNVKSTKKGCGNIIDKRFPNILCGQLGIGTEIILCARCKNGLPAKAEMCICGHDNSCHRELNGECHGRCSNNFNVDFQCDCKMFRKSTKEAPESRLQFDELDNVKGQTVKGANHISSNTHSQAKELMDKDYAILDGTTYAIDKLNGTDVKK